MTTLGDAARPDEGRSGRQARRPVTSVDRLQEVVREHHPDPLHPDRCAHCRFVYTPHRFECPPAQTAFARLNDARNPGRSTSSARRTAGQQQAGVPEPEVQALPPADDRLPCQRAPHQWDLDVGTLQGWGEALEGCLGCPMLQRCRTELERMYPRLGERGHGPMGLVWAGVAYGTDGQPLSWGQLRDRKYHRGMRAAA